MPETREERRVLTALFADMVGSTTLAERLDPEETRLIVGDALAEAIAAVERYGGTIKDLAGDGLLAFFGAPVAHEDDPERAVRAAAEIVSAIEDYALQVRRSWGVEDFAMRVGVHTGEVVTGQIGAGTRVEYGAVGDAINVAARLQGLASPGTVVVSDATHRLVAHLFEWGAPEQAQLKGRAVPVTVHRLVAVRGGRLADHAVAHARLIGRETELDRGRNMLAALTAGRGGQLFINGEAGIGKSRMIAEIRSMAAPEVLWLEGRCVSYGESLPYWPYRELLRDWLDLGAQDVELRARIALRRKVEQLFPDHVTEIYPYLATTLGLKLEPDAGARLTELSPESLQFRTFEVLQELLARLARDQPIVVVIDDLHWADATSLQLTERVLGLPQDIAMLLVVGQRPERGHASWALKEKAARDFPHLFEELNLKALDDDAERNLLQDLLGGGALPPALERRIVAYTEGNPFYLEEIVHSLQDHGTIPDGEDGAETAGESTVHIPGTIEGVIMARLDRLEPAHHDALTGAAVLGRSFSPDLLEGILDADASAVREALHELQRLDLIQEQRRWPHPEYRFKHALIQETAYGTLVASRRTALHRRAAQGLEEKHGDHPEEVYGLLAHHWRAAADREQAIRYLRLAGDRARDEYALDEAIGNYRELLPLLKETGLLEEVAETLFKLALALHTAMRFEEANQTYREAFSAWQPPAPAGELETATLRVATTFVPNDPDPSSAIAWPNIQLGMQLYDRLVEAWPNRNIVPSLAESWEVSPDGLRYVFRLRPDARWNDGAALVAGDIVTGVRRVLDPQHPGSSVSIYFVLEGALDYYLGHHRDPSLIGVRALDDRTVEFRLSAPAPYFINVVNRPDSGPQRPGMQVSSGPFDLESMTAEGATLTRNSNYSSPRRGNVNRVEMVRATMAEALEMFRRDEVDLVPVRYTPGAADLADTLEETQIGAATWSQFLTFNCDDPAGGNVHLRRALALAIDRDALVEHVTPNLVVATGGIVPPAVQGHTPEIALRFDPDRARQELAASGFSGRLEVAALPGAVLMGDFILRPIFESWRDVFGASLEPAVLRLDTPLGSLRPFGVEAALAVMGWLPGYPDPEYYLRLLLHSESRTNKGGWSYGPFDELIEQARQQRVSQERLGFFHEADRLAVQDQCALVPLTYGRSMVFVKPWVRGWWEWGKSSVSFADLVIDRTSPRYRASSETSS